jgi:hypothetical protein
MKPIGKRWPDNVEVFHIADLPVDTLDQGMMRLLRKIANEKGWTVEEVIVAAIEQRVERYKAITGSHREVETSLPKPKEFPQKKFPPNNERMEART